MPYFMKENLKKQGRGIDVIDLDSVQINGKPQWETSGKDHDCFITSTQHPAPPLRNVPYQSAAIRLEM
ncbi:MAG: hypothetical protein WCL27_16840 [Betaproteobacteria bacterium]